MYIYKPIIMTHKIEIPCAEREEVYGAIIPQIKSIVQGESDCTANLANVAAVLKQAFGFYWVGFYVVKGDELVLAPFQGTPACTRISKGRGVCGTAWATRSSQLVVDVDAFVGHIACSSESKSEVVVPIFKHGIVVGVLDVDSDKLGDFSIIDVTKLEEITKILENEVF